MNTDTLQRKVLVSLTVTIAFLVATILLVSVPASRFTSPPAREYAAGVARIILAFLVIVLIWRWNRVAHALKSPSPRSWAIVLACRALLADCIPAFIHRHVTLKPKSAK